MPRLSSWGARARILGHDSTQLPHALRGRIGFVNEEHTLPGWMRVDEVTSGELAFTRTLDEQYNQVVARKVGGKWIETARCKRLRACNLVSGGQHRLTMVVNHADDRKAFIEIDLAKQKRRVLHTDPAALSDLGDRLRRAAAGPWQTGQPAAGRGGAFS